MAELVVARRPRQEADGTEALEGRVAGYARIPDNKWRGLVTDQHQVNSIIATAICDCRKDQPDRRIEPEEAKQIAKCIVEALSAAGLQIMIAGKN